MKISLDIFNKLAKALNDMMEANDKLQDNDLVSNPDLVIELSKAMGVASAISIEAKALSGDISKQIGALSVPGLEDLDMGNLLDGLIRPNKGTKIN